MAGSRTNSGPATDLLVELQRDAQAPLHGQLATAIREGIRSGRLRPGNSLPPSRTLAAGLGVSRGVVVEAYQQLTAEGYLAARPGGYTRIAPGLRAVPPSAPPAAGPDVRIDFSPCRADVSQFPRGRGCARSAGSSTRHPTSGSATSAGTVRPSCARRWPTT